MFSRMLFRLPRSGLLTQLVRARSSLRANIVGRVQPKSRSRIAGSLLLPASAIFGAVYCAEPVLSDDVLVQQADSYYDLHLTEEVYPLLKAAVEAGNPSAEVLWRYARSLHDLAAELDDKEKAKKKALTYEGYEIAKQAVAKDPNNFACHKWMAIMISDIGEYEGSNAQLKNSYVIKEHFDKAIELNPKDATSRHLLGLWCFTFADMSWITRSAASAILTSPPKASYDDALEHFMTAEKMDPGFYPKNTLMIGKTLARKGEKKEAVVWLQKCLALTANNADDRAAHKEAEELLKTVA
eukprot:m.79618 g.79618  ORF g.79618 m.79618 type:complete len:297 (+) comp20868_c0_seq3:75-965(+)